MQLQPYLFFDGRCEEALNFYRDALGATIIMMMRYSDSPERSDASTVPRGGANKIMHASVRIGESVLMASDGHCTGVPAFDGFSLSLTVADDAEANRLFHVLAKGGKIQMPLTTTFFSSRFGMVTDNYGVSWMIVVGA